MIEQGEARLASCDADFFRAFAGLVDAFSQLDITPLLARITCPALVIAGEKDLLKPPRYSETIANGIADSQLVIVPGAGHAVVLERPQPVNQALHAFLESH